MFELDIHPVTIGKKNPKTRRLPPSMNSRMHWATKARWTSEFRDQTFWLCKVEKIPKFNKVKIILENHTTQPQDRDNLYSSAKPIIDGIVLAGVVEDDNEDYVDLQAKNIKVHHKNEQKVIIKLYGSL